MRKGDLRIIKQLLVKGANPNICDAQGRTALDIAEEFYDEDDYE